MSPFTQAMILAAGLGTRMRPLTNDKPKALVDVCGKPLLAHIMEKLVTFGIIDYIVNTHYKKEVLLEYLETLERVNIHPSIENTILETGGGILKALPLMENKPFIAINCDSLWLDNTPSLLEKLTATWNPDTMDALLALYPLAKMPDFAEQGDFSLNITGQLHRRGDYVYMGVQILHPRLFDTAPQGAFSLNVLYNQAIAAGRLYGVVHDGTWFHLSTPHDVTATEHILCKKP
jgi:MurNAc alpha-1-phosphate uridylyltransferase